MTTTRTPAADELRCGCGALLARWLPDGVELRCRRCRTLVFLRYPENGGPLPRPRVDFSEG